MTTCCLGRRLQPEELQRPNRASQGNQPAMQPKVKNLAGTLVELYGPKSRLYEDFGNEDSSEYEGSQVTSILSNPVTLSDIGHAGMENVHDPQTLPHCMACAETGGTLCLLRQYCGTIRPMDEYEERLGMIAKCIPTFPGRQSPVPVITLRSERQHQPYDKKG